MTGKWISFAKILVWLLFIPIIFPIWNIDAKESVAKKKPELNKKEPIQIVSDRLDAYNEKKLVVFSGHAVATQGDKTIKSDRLLLYYRKDAHENEKAASKKTDEMGDLEKIEAKGRVIVTQGGKIVTGDDAVFYQDTQKIIMTGNAVMREGRSVIRGDKIVVFLEEDRGVVESNENKRVKAVIYPEDKDKKSGRR